MTKSYNHGKLSNWEINKYNSKGDLIENKKLRADSTIRAVSQWEHDQFGNETLIRTKTDDGEYTQQIKYNEFQLPAEITIIQPNRPRVVKNYQYVLDRFENWVVKKERTNGENSIFTTRVIEYY